MPTRSSTAVWTGSIGDGSGSMTIGDGVWEGSFNVPSRFEEGDGTNPEELLGAAHAGCFSMALSGILTRAGHEVNELRTTADVTVEKGEDGWRITRIHLHCEGDVEGIDGSAFAESAQQAKENCPVSQALAGVDEVTVDAKLAG
ncbi:MAG: OsmC family peroxiredoxin [Nitriliruptorales bacterium]|nr:OsmC family peroxiredoxin [Nitriliruptorales bacterium]